MMTKSETKRKALSYIRFSTSQQGQEGRNSTKRQQDALEAAIAKWNLELDGEFKDAGRSGYHQRHLAKGGAMRQLRDLAIKGELKGKVLVVEDFDRVGRMEVCDAAPLLMDMLNNGVDLVVGAHGGEYFSKAIVNGTPFLFYKALDGMSRGHEESKRKTDMAKAKVKERLEKLAKGVPVGLNSIPFWLVNERNSVGACTGNFLVKNGMKELIKMVFDSYLAGNGSHVVARELNEKKIPLPPTRSGKARENANAWHSQFIQKLIKNRALLGFYNGTEHKVFPALITEETFYRANQKLQERKRFAGRKANHVNPYAGLCFCANCKGGQLTRHSSRKNQETVDKYVYLQCRNSEQGKCSAAGLNYLKFEESFKGLFPYVDFGKVKTDSTPLRSEEIKIKLAKVDTQIAKFKSILSAIEDPDKAVSLASMLTDCDTQRATLLKELEAETIRENGTPKLSKSHFEFLKSLYAKDSKKLLDPKVRLEIQEALRASIERITIDVKAQSYSVKWKAMAHETKVEFTKIGYKVSGQGVANIEVMDFNLLPKAA